MCCLSLFVGCRSLCVVVCCMMFGDSCSLCVVCCLLLVFACVLFVVVCVCRSLFVVRGLLIVAG